MAATAERDRYLFGALDSSAKNRAKVKEVNYGYEAAGGHHPDLDGLCRELDKEKLDLADDLRAGLLRY